MLIEYKGVLMKRAIKEKLLNLVTFNPIDYCIRSNVTQRHIDISKYVNKESFISFMEGETHQLEISATSGISAFESELKSARSPDEFVNIVQSNGFNITENRVRELNSNFIDAKKKATTYYVDQMKTFKRQFITLNRTANNIYNDSTIWPLYIVHRFLKGKINDIIIKAPLIIYKVAIVEEGSKLYIRKIDDHMIVNEKIQIVMNKEFPSIATSEELLRNVSFEDYIDRFQKMIGYKIDVDSQDLFVNFKIETSKVIEENCPRLQVENSALIGIFEPGGGALKEDLKEIIARDKDPFESQLDGDVKSNSYYEEKIIKDPTSIFEINKPLNIYQKYAVASSLNQSTLIYGPPGTGKSEVIANIISNALIKGKSTLMVSEKRAALDVLTKRMGSLSQFALYLYNTNDKEEFYKKIDSLNSKLGTQWYRESSRSSKNSTIEPLKFNKDELLFVKNYDEWYEELFRLIKKHWTIEDYTDGIYKLDYIDAQRLRSDLGEELCIEWLQTVNIDGLGNTTLLEAFKKIYSSGSYSFPTVDAFFAEYIKFKKFVRKYNLLENNTSEELNKYLRHIINKISANTKLVERYLLGGNKLNNLFQKYFEFTEKYDNKHAKLFLEKSYKDKKQFINLVSSYLSFKSMVIDKDPVLSGLEPKQIIEKINIIEKFVNKYKKLMATGNWFDFLIKNANKIEKFLSLYEQANSQEIAEVIYAEFVINSQIIVRAEESTLNFKQIKFVSRDINQIIPLFKEFLSSMEHLNNDYVEEIVQYKELFNYDVQYLSELKEISFIFAPEYQEILKEWNWISLPFIKYLYLNPIVPFDLDKIQPIMQLITSPISNDQFMKLKVIAMWSDIVKENPIFMELKGIHLQDIINQLKKEATRSASLVEELIYKKYINNLRTHLTKLSKEDKDEVANVLRIASSSARPPIGQFVKRYYNALKKLFPIWVARPDNVADMIPLNEGEFDYGIFDEASQMSIERAYPIVYRTNIKVVSGDDKQLKPTSFFMSKLNQNDYDIDDYDAVESLLERAKVSWWNEFHLKNHYRSDSKELIEFSNKFIYNNSLEVATKAGIFESGIEIHNVNGIWDQVNKKEAEKVIELLIEKHNEYETILVITFNSRQSQLIENVLFERRTKLPEKLAEMIETNKVTITNLENVQGNEGELVILSVSYGRNPEGIIRSNFGPLILSGGSNRLNVAITRARRKMIVVKSIYAHQIKVNINNKNAVIFKKFIEYIDGISNNQSIDSIDYIDSNENVFDKSKENDQIEDVLVEEDEIIEENIETKKDIVEESEKHFSSRIVKEIYGELIKSLNNKFTIINDFKVGSKNIELLVINNQTKKPVKAILVEEWKKHRTIKDMLEDIDRQYFLDDRGYSTYRIKEFMWCIDKNRIMQKIKDSIMNNNGNDQIDYILWQSDK